MRLRRLFPQSGPGYELFDTSVLLFLVGLLGYVLTIPAPVNTDALAPLRIISELALGTILTIAGLTGIACAYSTRPRVLHVAYTLTVALIMCINYAIGSLQTWELRPVVSAVFYGWIARKLMRDQRRGGV